MERQQELFGEFKDTETKERFFQKALPEKAFTLTFAYEKLILLILGFILILAIVFAFGFERGKRSVLAKHVITQPVVKPPPSVEKPAQEIKKTTTQAIIKPYTIQVATFKSKEYAQAEVSKLRKRGYSTTVIGINGLYQIWVGEYNSPKEAEQALNVLKKTYNTCYIRKR